MGRATFSLSVLIWMAFGMSLAVFSLVMEVTSFSRMVIYKEKAKDLPQRAFLCTRLLSRQSLSKSICKQAQASYRAADVTLSAVRVSVCTRRERLTVVSQRKMLL